MENQRALKFKKNVLAMLLIKGGAMLISLLYVPLLLHTMDSVNYGIWLTLTSIISWVSLMDIGLGNGLRNKLAESLAKDDIQNSRIYVSTAYVSIIMLVLFLIIIFLFCYKSIDWNIILNANNIERTQIESLILIVFVAFCVQFALGLINSVLYALQMPAISSFIGLLGQLVAFIVVYILSEFGYCSLLLLGSVVAIIPPIIQLLSSFYIYVFKYPFLCPSLNCFDSKKIKDILSLGIKFFILQIITIVLFQSNNIIITHAIGNEAVVEYNIAYKYMSVLLMIYSMIVMPMWSASTDAYYKNDYHWIKQTVRKIYRLILLFVVVGLIMVIISPYVYSIWIGNNSVNIKMITTILLYVYVVSMILYQTFGYIINGIGKLKLQMILTSGMAMLYIPISYLLGCKYGLTGVLVLFAINAIFNFIWAKIQYTKLINRTAIGIWNS